MVKSVLENRKVKIILIVAAALFGIYLFIGSWVSRIHIGEQAVTNAWQALKLNCDYRVELLADWGKFLKHYVPEASVAYQDLKTAYDAAKQNPSSLDTLKQKRSLQGFVNIQLTVSNALQKMYSAMAEQPQLLENRDFQRLNSETEVVELQIVYTAKTLNETIGRYNQSISGVPGGWVNLFLKSPAFFTFSLPGMVITPKTASGQL